MARAFEGAPADDELGARKTKRERFSVSIGSEKTSGVVEVEVTQDDLIDVALVEPERGERLEQHVRLFDDAVALTELRLEERTDAGLEQRALAGLFHEKRSACELDSAELVGSEPTAPERLRRITEHRAAVEALTVSENRTGEHDPKYKSVRAD